MVGSYLECYLPYKEEDLIANNRESKSVIEFRICPSSFHLDTWVTKEDGDADRDNELVKILFWKQQPLRSEKCVQIEIDVLPTASSSSILSDVLLADVPYLPLNTRERLASDLICAIRELINKKLTPLLNKKLVISMMLQFCTFFRLKPLREFKQRVFGRSNNFQISSSEEEECAICLHKYIQSSEPIGSMLCLHKFHLHCLYSWWGSKRGSCPLCRFEMPVPPLYFDELAERLKNDDVGDDDIRWRIYIEESLHHYEKYK